MMQLQQTKGDTWFSTNQLWLALNFKDSHTKPFGQLFRESLLKKNNAKDTKMSFIENKSLFSSSYQ